MTAVCVVLINFWTTAISSAWAQDDSANTITLLAAEIPGGFLKIEGTHGVGVYPDLLYEAAADANVNIVLQFVPCRRAFNKVETSKHLLAFPLTRLPEREDKYTWLVPNIFFQMPITELVPRWIDGEPLRR